MMFLSKGRLPHEPIWRMWFAQAIGVLPKQQATAALCGADTNGGAVPQTLQAVGLQLMQQLCAVEGTSDWPAPSTAAADKDSASLSNVISRQHLFSAYVHTPPSFEGFNTTSIFYRHQLPHRVAVIFVFMCLSVYAGASVCVQTSICVCGPVRMCGPKCVHANTRLIPIASFPTPSSPFYDTKKDALGIVQSCFSHQAAAAAGSPGALKRLFCALVRERCAAVPSKLGVHAGVA